MSREILFSLLEKIDKFSVAPGTKRQKVIPRKGNAPYKYALLKGICIAWGDKESKNLRKRKAYPSELLPWFRMILISEFPNRFQKVGREIAQPIWRMTVTDEFWRAIDNDGNEIDISKHQNTKNSIKTISNLKSVNFSHCLIPDDLKAVLDDGFDRTVLSAFLTAKMEQCKSD
jgi:hypothetical protein